MAAPFAFIPRKVAATRASAASSGKVASATIAKTTVQPRADTHVSLKQSMQSSDGKNKQTSVKAKSNTGESKLSEKDCAVLISLALSDHAIWADPDLRRTIEQNNENCRSRPAYFVLFYFISFTDGLGRHVKSSPLGTFYGIQIFWL